MISNFNKDTVNIESIVLRDMSEDDRPCDKAWNSPEEIKALSTSELISIILGNGVTGKCVTTIAQDLFAEYNNSLTELVSGGIKKLAEFPGIGKIKSVRLMAAIELGTRYRDENFCSRKSIKCASDIFWMMRSVLETKKAEEFWIICLNKRYVVIGKPVRISTGLSDAAPVTVKSVFSKVLEYGDIVEYVVFVHNHPDNSCHPSVDDISLTSVLTATARNIVDVVVFDHVIVTPDGRYYSFKENGLL